MSEDKGWVKLHRDMMGHWLWEDKPFDRARAWIDLIMLANHKNDRFLVGNHIVDGQRGTVYRSISWLADRWGWGRKKTRNFLTLLESEKMVIIKGTTQGTTITLVNYDKFQNVGPTDGTTKEQRRNSEGTTKEQRGNTYKNDKNDKNDKNFKEEGDARARGSGFSFLLDEGEYELTEDQLDELIRRYPELDVRREMIRISEWCKDNPGKRKAESDAWRFITGWMTRSSKEAAAPLVMKPSAPKNSFHNFAERGESLEAIFSGDIVSEEGA